MSNDEIADDSGDHDQVYTLDEALTEVGFGKFQAWVLCYAGLGCVAEAMEMMILSFVGPAVKSEWGLSSMQETLITTVVFVGMLVGAYSWGVISDNLGRRKGLLSVAAVTSISAFVSSFSTNYAMLIIFRMLVGVGLGGGPVYSSWFLEFVPPRKRGIWMVIFSTFWSFGTIFEASLAWVIMPRFSWRWLLALSSVPCFAALFFYGFVVESPRYLYMKGKITNVNNMLRNMAMVNKTQLPSGLLASECKNDVNIGSASVERDQMPSDGTNEGAILKASFLSLTPLFSSKLVKTTLLLWVVYFGNAFAYYGIILLTSELVNGQNRCGRSSLSSDSGNTSLYKDVFITSFAELPGLVFSAILVDFIGRKKSMALMYAISFVFLLPLVVHQHEIITTILLFGARMCINGTFTVASIYCPELYPTAVRSTGYGVANAVGRIGGMISPVVAVQMMAGCHRVPAIVLFEVVITLGGISVMLFPVETKGRELTDSVV